MGIGKIEILESFKISGRGVEMIDKISTRESWVGLMFVYNSKKEQDEFEKSKLPTQTVGMLDSD